jgi:predicted amidohydrolase
MPREVTIALVQMAPALANPEANLRKMGDFVEKICSEQKTDLIVFPELSYTGTELGLRATDLAERAPGHATNYLAKRANDFGVHVVFGMVIKERVESILYNGVVCVGPEGDLWWATIARCTCWARSARSIAMASASPQSRPSGGASAC